MTNLTLNAAFSRMCRAGLNSASKDDVVTVAVGMWHYNQMPNMDGLPEDAMKVGAFVLDRLARFACVSVEFKNRVFHFLDELANQLAKRVDTPTASAKIDKLAVKWGVNADLRGYMKELLPLQTRHAFC